MAETVEHRDIMIYAILAAQALLKDRPGAYVSGNDFLYYEKDNPRKNVSPDCYVVFGVDTKPKHERNNFKTWLENDQLPVFVLETTSKSTRREDVEIKAPLYESLGVREYIRFDPTGDYLNPCLQGSHLVEGVYVPMEMIDGRLTSEVLNAFLVVEGRELRFIDRRTGMTIATAKEDREGREFEKRRADAEAEARTTAEQEIARLRAALEAALAGQSRGNAGADE